MERYCRNLECQPADDERDGDSQQWRLPRSARRGAGLQVGRDRREVGRACHAIDEADAVEQQDRCEGTQQEVLHRRLIRDGLVACDADQNVGAQRHELQTQVQNQEFGGRRGQHHARRGQQEQRIVLGGPNALRIEMSHREQRHQRQVRREEDLEKQGVAVGRDCASESHRSEPARLSKAKRQSSTAKRPPPRSPGLRQPLRARRDVRRR